METNIKRIDGKDYVPLFLVFNLIDNMREYYKGQIKNSEEKIEQMIENTRQLDDMKVFVENLIK